jgi:hypothetical protein
MHVTFMCFNIPFDFEYFQQLKPIKSVSLLRQDGYLLIIHFVVEYTKRLYKEK